MEFGLKPPPGPYGDELVVDFARGDSRAFWDATLIAFAFARRSRDVGLTKIAYFSDPDGGQTLGHARPAAEPLSPARVEAFCKDIAGAARDATVERIEVLRPQGHAFAITLHVLEPHAYLRRRLVPFLEAVAEWRERCDGIYTEVRDGQPRPVLFAGWHRSGGFSGARRDLACCAPHLGLSRPLEEPPPPICPIFDAA
jgi:hypothetical protein